MAHTPKTAPKTAPKPRRRKPATPKSRTFGVGLLSAGAAAIGLGATLLAVMLRRKANPAEHAAPDLAADRPAPGAHDRAPEAFRPDPTAPVPPELRESLRPATGHASGFAADRGTAFNQGQDAA